MGSSQNRSALKILLTLAILGVSISLSPLSFALAQGGDTAVISEISTDQFPSISFNLAVYDAQGNFLKDINQEDLRIQENGNLLNANSLNYSEPGLQMVVAVNPGPALGYLADQTVRFEKIRQVLSDWIASRPENALDDYSFVTQEGVVESRLSDPALFQQVLMAYQPAFADSKPDLQSLSAALDLALEPNPRPLMHRAILYITPLPTEDQLPGLNDMISRAAQLDVKVFVWMVAYPSSADALGAEALRQLAARTGGQFFLFSGIEPLPDPETYLLPLRGIYSVNYTSMLDQSGVNTLSVTIQHGAATIVSAPVTFEINILPPNPFLLSPPTEIDRSWTSGRATAENLSPASVDLNYLVEFPDGYERNIQTVDFFVDGEQVLEISNPQNETLTWQLPAETVTTTHKVQVEVTDTLGLTGRSLEIPIQIVVPSAPKTWLQNLAGYFTGTRVLILFAMVLSAAILVAVVYFSSRSYRLNLARRPARSVYKDPVTQPVRVHNEVRSTATGRDQKAAASAAVPVLARLIPLAKGKESTSATTLNVRHPLELIGSDARQVTLFIDSASISAIHARLILNDVQEFILSDEDSIAGTWVNYAPVSKKGIHLENNDLVSFGKTSFRFEILQMKNANSQKTGE